MSEVIFKCPTCSKNLCAGDTAIGRVFDCPTCHYKVTLPEPDFTFNCTSCSAELSSLKNMVGETFDCPSCEQGFTIPSNGRQFIPPLKQKAISITCPSCSVELELEINYYKEMEGKIIDCPQCNKAIPLFSKNSHTPRIETQTDVAITPPEWPDQPSCPGCHTAMAPNAVICLTCGLDLRTGQKFTLPQEKRKLSFKQEESPPDEPNNSVLVRYFMPKSRRKTISVKLFSVLKMISVLVIISGMGLAAVQYVDISAVINKIKGLF